MSFCAIILAAGDGAGMKSSRPKVMCEILGEPMISWVIDSVRAAGLEDDKIGIVAGCGADTVKEYLSAKGSFPVFLQKERRQRKCLTRARISSFSAETRPS